MLKVKLYIQSGLSMPSTKKSLMPTLQQNYCSFVYRLAESRAEASRASQAHSELQHAHSQLQHAHSQLQAQAQNLHSDLQETETFLQSTAAEKAKLEGMLREAREEAVRLREGVDQKEDEEEEEGEGEPRTGLVEEVARLELEVERLCREGEEREEEMAALQNQLRVKTMNWATIKGVDIQTF